MIYYNDFTLPTGLLLEQIYSKGLDFLPTLIAIPTNTAMQAEYSIYLQARPYERITARDMRMGKAEEGHNRTGCDLGSSLCAAKELVAQSSSGDLPVSVPRRPL